MFQIWMSHVKRHDSFISEMNHVTYLSHESCHVTHSYLTLFGKIQTWYDLTNASINDTLCLSSDMKESWHIWIMKIVMSHIWMSPFAHMRHDSFISDDKQHSNVTHMNESFCTCASISPHSYQTCAMTHSYMTWLIHLCNDWFVSDMFHSHVSYMNESWNIWLSHVTYEWVMSYVNESWYIWLSHVTYEWVMSYMNESWHIWLSHVT